MWLQLDGISNTTFPEASGSSWHKWGILKSRMLWSGIITRQVELELKTHNPRDQGLYIPLPEPARHPTVFSFIVELLRAFDGAIAL